MLQILLMGVAVVAIYLIAHVVVTAIERRHGKALGFWRSILFFVVFLTLMLIATQLVPVALGALETT
jgi:hypothetical protein